MDALSAVAERMRPGAIFVTVLCPLSSDKFELVDEAELKFSWGFVEALVHRRMTDDAAALARCWAIPCPACGETTTWNTTVDGSS